MLLVLCHYTITKKGNGLSPISSEAVRIALYEIRREARDCVRVLCTSIVVHETSHISLDDCFAAFLTPDQDHFRDLNRARKL